LNGILSQFVKTLINSIRVIFCGTGITGTNWDERSSSIVEIVSAWDTIVRNWH
jgi:hypothetical protein